MVEAESDRKEASPLVANMKFLEIREKKFEFRTKHMIFGANFVENVKIYKFLHFFFSSTLNFKHGMEEGRLVVFLHPTVFTGAGEVV